MRRLALVLAVWVVLGAIAAPVTREEMLERCMVPPQSQTLLVLLWLPAMWAALATPSEC